MKLFIFLLIFSLYTPIILGQFTNVGAATNTDHGNAKDGGVAWADLNNDGCLDLVINTNNNNAANRTRILFSDCNLPNPSFTDVTAANAAGLTAIKCERSVSVGDFNNDGYIDIARNTHTRYEVYLNNGPTSTPAYSFGAGVGQTPNQTITAVPGGINIEGFGWMDYNNDGWLDLILENHQYGIDIFENPADGSANFFHVTPNASTKGFPTGCAGSSHCAGDYMVLGDYNDDGYVDILARKEDSNNADNDVDLWTNNGDGTFTSNVTINQDANGSNKGGVLFCDFDDDGDFDIFWSDNDGNEIFEQTGVNSGIFVATAEPATSSGVTPHASIDGCDCGDVDNDGDMDLVMGGSSTARTYLFLNDGTGNMEFTRNNMGIAAAGNKEGMSFGDYDNDGDLDLYVNRNGGANELWRNPTASSTVTNTNFLKVNVKKDLGGGVYRDDLGATLIMKDCFGGVIGGIRQVSSVKGHGSNSPAVVHFGLPFGNMTSYLLEVRFTANSIYRPILDTTIVPSIYPNQTVTIIEPVVASSFMDGCHGIILPVELDYFTAKTNENDVDIEWQTLSEINSDYFVIEKSQDGEHWKEVDRVNAAENSNSILSYSARDYEPFNGTSYYKLIQYDINGDRYNSQVKTVNFGGLDMDISIYPNPAETFVNVVASKDQLKLLRIINTLGQDITNEVEINKIGSTKYEINFVNLPSGAYFVQLGMASKKILIK